MCALAVDVSWQAKHADVIGDSINVAVSAGMEIPPLALAAYVGDVAEPEELKYFGATEPSGV